MQRKLQQEQEARFISQSLRSLQKKEKFVCGCVKDRDRERERERERERRKIELTARLTKVSFPSTGFEPVPRVCVCVLV